MKIRSARGCSQSFRSQDEGRMSSDRSSVVRDHLSINYLSLTLGVLTVLLIHGSLGQDIVFPDERPPINQRIGITTVPPSTISCPMNMSLSQRANETEGFCECIIGNLYYPKLDRCFLQYTRGPCDKGEYFILQKNAMVAECVRNPCTKKDTVPYKGSCYGLYLTGGPCKPNETLSIPATSFEPKCVEIVTTSYQIITVPRRGCGPGTRRASHGKCRKIIP